jgi:hypothetical protein
METNVHCKRKTQKERLVRRRSFKGFLNERPEVIKKWKGMKPSLRAFLFGLTVYDL